MARQVMDLAQIVELNDALKMFCSKKEGEEGVAVYKDGWDDQAILKYVTEMGKTGRPYNLNHVSNLRKELFGDVKKPTKKLTDMVSMAVEIAELRQLVEEHGRRIKALEQNKADHPLIFGSSESGSGEIVQRGQLELTSFSVPERGPNVRTIIGDEAAGYRGTKPELRAHPKS